MTVTERPGEELQRAAQAVEAEVAKVIVGQRETVRGAIIALLAGGHALLEGVPGLGKTMLVKTLGDVLDLQYSRIQFTPDLMPADITGTNIIVDDLAGGKRFNFEAGPIFANIVLADEINRATPKTQSALLEAMQEGTVTVGNQGRPLPKPFFVLATQNPLEMEGTYPLPEAQLDRFFFKLHITYPSRDELMQIITRTTSVEMERPKRILDSEALLQLQRLVREVPIARHVMDYAVRLVMATHPEREDAPPKVKSYVRYGASPRGAQALVLAAKINALLEGRYNVAYEDIRQVAMPALRHRLILNFEGEVEGVTPDQVLEEVMGVVPGD